ncbi:hypothetical protein [Bartonella queenslandensis]|uniref:hypothetical protein n=1 Tax=Bartonella queenslandensis TaxID=481138 RepID=UPI0002FF7876|nr:hypothetical protein [Bartonella queenslandensis]
MEREALLRELRKEARKRGIHYSKAPDAGKGSHYLVTLGNKTTVIKSGELTSLYVKIIKNNWEYKTRISYAFNVSFQKHFDHSEEI